MNYSEPTSQPEPESLPEFVSARARRRRAQRRAYFPSDEEGRSDLFAHLARRAYPSYELFVFSLVSGAILGLGYFINSQALLIFGILVAPLMTPWVGMSLAVVAGSARFFAQTFSALFVSSLLIFLCGILAGFASRTFGPLTFNEAFTHSRLWWPDILIITIGAIILTISFVRSEERPYLPSALLTYGLFLPLCAAGFGLGSGVSEIWPQGLYVFFVHLAWATFFAIITLFFLRFHPTSPGGIAFTALMIITLLMVVTFLTGFNRWMMIQAGLAPEPFDQTQGGPAPVVQATSPSPAPVSTSTSSPRAEQATAPIGVLTHTPPRAPSRTPAATLPPTETSTSTITAEPTPIIGIIRASEGGGAFIREKPGGIVVATLGNGSTVTIIPNDLQDVNNVIWVHVFALVNDVRIEGWMIQSVLQTATPVANWQPSPTP
ncbi:MAG: DUF389 domain-containing protein [Anaerolineales bacterium]